MCSLAECLGATGKTKFNTQPWGKSQRRCMELTLSGHSPLIPTHTLTTTNHSQGTLGPAPLLTPPTHLRGHDKEILRVLDHAKDTQGKWSEAKTRPTGYLPGRPMPIFSRSSFLTYSKWDRRVMLRSSRSLRKYCCSCTSDSSSNSQPVPSSGCMLLLPSLCGKGKTAEGPGDVSRRQETCTSMPLVRPRSSELSTCSLTQLRWGTDGAADGALMGQLRWGLPQTRAVRKQVFFPNLCSLVEGTKINLYAQGPRGITGPLKHRLIVSAILLLNFHLKVGVEYNGPLRSVHWTPHQTDPTERSQPSSHCLTSPGLPH